MSAPTYVVNCAPVALTASTTKSLWLLNPAVVSFRLTEVGVTFDGSSAATAIRVDLYRTTTVGSATGTTFTVVKSNSPLDVAPQTTAQTIITTEPTAVELLRSWYLSPANGLMVLQFPLGREPSVANSGSQRLGLRCVVPASVSPNAVSYVEWEE
jgi:hypothetical protein